MSEELKPCPFCGQQDAFVEQLDSDASVVICQGMVDEHSACLARGPVGVQQSDMEDQPGRDAAVAEWNRRAQPAEAEGVEHWSGLRLAAEVAEEDGPWEPRLGMTNVEAAFAQSASPTRVLELIAALSAVTAERDLAVQGGLQIIAERDQLRAEVEALRVDATLGSAIQRACCDLPDGFMISVSLEKDAGTLELCLPDTDAVLDDFDGETFADKIHAAIDAAMAAK